MAVNACAGSSILTSNNLFSSKKTLLFLFYFLRALFFASKVTFLVTLYVVLAPVQRKDLFSLLNVLVYSTLCIAKIPPKKELFLVTHGRKNDTLVFLVPTRYFEILSRRKNNHGREWFITIPCFLGIS